VGGPPDRIPPDPAQWRVTSPAAGTTSALVIDFPNPMNYSLLLRMIQVAQITGRVEVARHETEWRFTPDSPWQQRDYHLVIDTGIEDIAGNHIGAAFDIDIFEKVSKTIDRKTVTIPFSIR
jgi:hypothetical protein